jgi:hypothetical protein
MTGCIMRERAALQAGLRSMSPSHQAGNLTRRLALPFFRYAVAYDDALYGIDIT